MKKCTICHMQKLYGDYYYRNRALGQLHSQCKSCYAQQRNQYSAEHYKKYGEVYRLRARERKTRVKSHLRTLLLRYMQEKCCVLCAESDIRVLDFDHINPKSKSFSISTAIANCYDWTLIEAEISKCRILCANCHRKHTAQQQSWYKQLLLEAPTGIEPV